MRVEVVATGDGKQKLTLFNEAPGFTMTSWFSVKTADGTITEHGSAGGFDDLRAEIILEDNAARFLTPFPNTSKGWVEVTVVKRFDITGRETRYTETHNYTILENSYTRPSFAAKITAMDLLNGYYISHQSSVQAEFSDVEAKYGASIVSKQFTVGAKTYGEPFKSDTLDAGRIALTCTVTDTRGFESAYTQEITAYDYFPPMISAVSDTNSITVRRVDRYGNPDESGNYLYIAAKVTYSKLDGGNSCTMTCRYKQGTTGAWNDEILLTSGNTGANEYNGIVSKNASGENIILIASVLYPVQIIAKDSMGNSNTVLITIPTESVYMDKAGTRNSIAFGGHVTENDAFEVYQNAYFRRGIYIDDLKTGARYKLVIRDGTLVAEEQTSTFSLKRR